MVKLTDVGREIHKKAHDDFCENFPSVSDDIKEYHPKKEDIRENMRKRFLGEKNPMYGKHWKWTEEQISHMRGRKVTEETKKKLSNSLSGEKNPMFGRHETSPNFGKKIPESQKKKISESVLKYWEGYPEKREECSGDKNIAKRPGVRRKIRIMAKDYTSTFF